MSAIIGQVLPFLSQEHQQQVATAVERAKTVTMSDLNSAVAGVRTVPIFKTANNSPIHDESTSKSSSYVIRILHFRSDFQCGCKCLIKISWIKCIGYSLMSLLSWLIVGIICLHIFFIILNNSPI